MTIRQQRQRYGPELRFLETNVFLSSDREILKLCHQIPNYSEVPSKACMGQVVELDCWYSYAGLTCKATLLSWAVGWAAELGCLAELLGWAAGGLNFYAGLLG